MTEQPRKRSPIYGFRENQATFQWEVFETGTGEVVAAVGMEVPGAKKLAGEYYASVIIHAALERR